ncbi:MAG: hypothetical protein IKS51_03260 [Erysipelotrichaceae bacterium]|nr:hypothetical protein [Erysipelotrichaceae bacterium]
MKISWKDKVDLIIMNPQVSLKQIQKLLDVGQPSAIKIREETLKLAKKNGRWVSVRKVPTDLLLETVGLDYDYFKTMARNELSAARNTVYEKQ